MTLRRLLISFSLGLSLVACQAGIEHAEITKRGITIDQANLDLAACRFEGEKAAGQIPIDGSVFAVAAWRDRRDRLADFCLQTKGYAVQLHLPGSCQGQCLGTIHVSN